MRDFSKYYWDPCLPRKRQLRLSFALGAEIREPGVVLGEHFMYTGQDPFGGFAWFSKTVVASEAAARVFPLVFLVFEIAADVLSEGFEGGHIVVIAPGHEACGGVSIVAFLGVGLAEEADILVENILTGFGDAVQCFEVVFGLKRFPEAGVLGHLELADRAYVDRLVFQVPEDKKLFVAVGADPAVGDRPEDVALDVGPSHVFGVVVLVEEVIFEHVENGGGFPTERLRVKGFCVRQHGFPDWENGVCLQSAVFCFMEEAHVGGLVVVHSVGACGTQFARAVVVFVEVADKSSVVYS